MDLATAVKKYLSVAGGFDRAMHLSFFGLSKDETERTISEWDEDYQISRYMMLTRDSDDVLRVLPEHARTYTVNGFEYSHVTFHADIEKLL